MCISSDFVYDSSTTSLSCLSILVFMPVTCSLDVSGTGKGGNVSLTVMTEESDTSRGVDAFPVLTLRSLGFGLSGGFTV